MDMQSTGIKRGSFVNCVDKQNINPVHRSICNYYVPDSTVIVFHGCFCAWLLLQQTVCFDFTFKNLIMTPND